MNTPTNDLRSLLDLDQLEPFIEIGMEEFLDIFQDVTTEVPIALDVLRSAIAQADAPTFKGRCHSLRGMVANFGLKALAHQISHYEKQGSIPLPTEAENIHGELLKTWQDSCAAIQTWQQQLPSIQS